MISNGVDAVSAHAEAVALLSDMVLKQAMVLSYYDCFIVIGMCFLVSLPLVMVFHKSKLNGDLEVG